jgi:nucleotide-binding universal stress UspA family protein
MTIQHKKILVPLDGSALAAQAIPHAQALADSTQAELVLVRVVPDTGSLPQVLDGSRNFVRIEEREQMLIDEATRWLDTVAIDLRVRHPVSTVVLVGSPAAKIIDYARDYAVDLIVMSTHGRGGLARWVYGSVADKVLQAAHCPVYLVRSTSQPST